MTNFDIHAYAWLIIGLLAIVVSGYFIFSIISPGVYDHDDVSDLTVSANKMAVAKAEEIETGFGPGALAQKVSANYEEVRAQYIDRWIQIENCRLQPHSITYKNNTNVMFDNRSPDGQGIIIDGQEYRFWDYEFKIIALKSDSLPHTVDIDCYTQGEPHYNVARVLLQF